MRSRIFYAIKKLAGKALDNFFTQGFLQHQAGTPQGRLRTTNIPLQQKIPLFIHKEIVNFRMSQIKYTLI